MPVKYTYTVLYVLRHGRDGDSVSSVKSHMTAPSAVYDLRLSTHIVSVSRYPHQLLHCRLLTLYMSTTALPSTTYPRWQLPHNIIIIQNILY